MNRGHHQNGNHGNDKEHRGADGADVPRQERLAVGGGFPLAEGGLLIRQIAHGVDVGHGDPEQPGIGHADLAGHAEAAKPHADVGVGNVGHDEQGVEQVEDQ